MKDKPLVIDEETRRAWAKFAEEFKKAAEKMAKLGLDLRDRLSEAGISLDIDLDDKESDSERVKEDKKSD